SKPSLQPLKIPRKLRIVAMSRWPQRPWQTREMSNDSDNARSVQDDECPKHDSPERGRHLVRQRHDLRGLVDDKNEQQPDESCNGDEGRLPKRCAHAATPCLS